MDGAGRRGAAFDRKHPVRWKESDPKPKRMATGRRDLHRGSAVAGGAEGILGE